MKVKVFILLAVFLIFGKTVTQAQSIDWQLNGNNLFYSDGNVGIGKNNPYTKLDVAGSLELSTGGTPTGLIPELFGMNSVLNLSVNFREPDKKTYYRGADFKIDTRSYNYSTPTFQWYSRPPLSSPEKLLMTLNEDGNLGLGTLNPSASIDINTTNATKLSIKGNNTTWEEFLTPNDGSKYYIKSPSDSNRLEFATFDGTNGSTHLGVFKIIRNGDIVMGNNADPVNLSVNGQIKTKELVVTNTGWADYVFDENYKLPDLLQIEQYINENNHLPNILSTLEIEQKGLSLGEMQKLQMEKIESLYMYVIELQKEINLLKAK